MFPVPVELLVQVMSWLEPIFQTSAPFGDVTVSRSGGARMVNGLLTPAMPAVVSDVTRILAVAPLVPSPDTFQVWLPAPTGRPENSVVHEVPPSRETPMLTVPVRSVAVHLIVWVVPTVHFSPPA